jgi:hypothetical protein
MKTAGGLGLRSSELSLLPGGNSDGCAHVKESGSWRISLGPAGGVDPVAIGARLQLVVGLRGPLAGPGGIGEPRSEPYDILMGLRMVDSHERSCFNVKNPCK